MALGESTLSLLEDLSSLAPSDKNSFDRLNMFGIIRMLETAIVNIDRVHLLWDSVIAHLDCLANCKYPHLRSLAVDCLTCFIINAFFAHAKCQEDKEAIESPESYQKFWQKGTWQPRILSPLLNCLKSGYYETVKTTIQNLPNIIEVT